MACDMYPFSTSSDNFLSALLFRSDVVCFQDAMGNKDFVPRSLYTVISPVWYFLCGGLRGSVGRLYRMPVLLNLCERERGER